MEEKKSINLNEDKLLTYDQVGEILHIKRSMIRNLCISGKLHPISLSYKCIRFFQSDIEKYLISRI